MVDDSAERSIMQGKLRDPFFSSENFVAAKVRRRFAAPLPALQLPSAHEFPLRNTAKGRRLP